MTEQTPNTMPSAVRSERSLWSQRLLTPRRTVRLSRSNNGPRITPIDANELVEDSDIKQFFSSPPPPPPSPPPPPCRGGGGGGGSFSSRRPLRPRTLFLPSHPVRSF